MDTLTPNIISSRPGELLAGSNEPYKSFLSKVYRILDAPENGAQTFEVLQAVALSLECVSDHLIAPADQLIKLKSEAQGCLNFLKCKMGTNVCSSASSLDRKAGKHPTWVAFAKLGKEQAPHRAALALAGCAFLKALPTEDQRFHSDKRKDHVSKSICTDLRHLLSQPQISKEKLKSLLQNGIPEDLFDQEWTTRLQKGWRHVLRLFSSPEIPPPTNSEMIRSQIFSSIMNTGAAHRAGASSHRNLSDRQFNAVLEHLRQELAADTLIGALGVLVLRTGLSVDVVANLQIGSLNLSQTTTPGLLDIRLGIVELDIGVAVHEAAVQLKSAEPSEYKLRISLPDDLHKKLVKRLVEQPGAKTLSDLYPGSTLPNTSESIFDSRDEIEASWARLRNTLGLYLRNSGFNTLYAALLSGDLGLIPRSKLYYASVGAEELHTEEQKLYHVLGLEEAVDRPHVAIGTGCRTVPTAITLVLHDKALVAALEAQRPGKHAGLQRLYAFHNKFTLLCAWRLSILLALRATQAIDLDASIQEGSDKWVAIHDKHTPEDKGFQPVPLCSYAAEVIRLYKTHCAAMHRRIDSMPRASRDFSLWCSSVARSSGQRLLGCVRGNGMPIPVSSREFTSSTSEAYELPDDVGRKVMENMLRSENIKSSHIDSVLRHFSMGQIRSSGFNTESLASFIERTARAQDQIASKLFGSQVIGLTR